MSDVEKLKKDIERLKREIDTGKYQGEKLLLAKDMLSDLKYEYRKASIQNKVTAVPDVQIKALKKPTKKSISQMTGGAKTM